MDCPLFDYTFPCTFGNEVVFKKILGEGVVGRFLSEDSSVEEVRDYFFEVHNPREVEMGNRNHLVIPYVALRSDNVWYLKIREPFFPVSDYLKFRKISKERIRNSLLRRKELSPGGIIVFHCAFPVDYLTSDELVKYDYLYDENSRVW